MAECAPVPRLLASEYAAVTAAEKRSGWAPVSTRETFGPQVGPNVCGFNCRNIEVLATSASSAS